MFGGDFNSRCAMCGDKVLNTSGRQLLHFCCENSLAIINASAGVCVGTYTRVQKVTLDGKECLEQSCVDYVLSPTVTEHAVQSLTIVEDSYLLSDHRPLLASVRWDAADGPQPRRCTRPGV